MASGVKRTRGRQKIEMRKIEDPEDRMITFSKRRSGIYKKASEIVIMCGAEVGIIVFSPTGKPYSYGHPTVQGINNRYLGRDNFQWGAPGATNDRLQPIIDAHEKMRLDRYNVFFNRLLNKLNAEKEDEKSMGKIDRAIQDGNPSNWPLGWWERLVEGLSLNELREVTAFMEDFHKHLCAYLNHPVDLVGLGLADADSSQSTSSSSEDDESV